MCRFKLILIALVLVSTSIANAQIISGSATVELNGPASQEQTIKAQELSRKSMKTELVKYFSNSMDIDLDTLNPVKNYTFEAFIDSCMIHAEKSPSFKGKNITLNYHITADKVKQLLQTYNASMEASAIEAWNAFVNACSQELYNSVFKEGAKALSYAVAYIGKPITVPNSPSISLFDSCKTTLQGYFDRIKVTSSDMIIQGKAGQALNDAPKIAILIDSIPLQGIEFCGLLPNGKIYFSATSDQNGEVSFNNFKIPFVSNGTLLYVGIDFSATTINNATFIKPQDYGIKLRNSQDQTFIFKVERPIYTLNYSAISVNNVKIPQEYSTDSYLQKFLKDSCYMQKSSGSVPPDLIITVKSQVSSYDFDETEKTGVKFSNEFVIKGLSTNPPRTKSLQTTFENVYEQNITIPYGLLFWEANSHLRENLKKVIEQL